MSISLNTQLDNSTQFEYLVEYLKDNNLALVGKPVFTVGLGQIGMMCIGLVLGYKWYLKPIVSIEYKNVWNKPTPQHQNTYYSNIFKIS